MSRSDEEGIADILDAAQELDGIVARGRDSLLAETVLQRAAERLLEIIGEAASGISEESRSAFPGIPWRDITRLRIVIAHHYHRVDPGQVWTIASEDVPALTALLGPHRPTRG